MVLAAKVSVRTFRDCDLLYSHEAAEMWPDGFRNSKPQTFDLSDFAELEKMATCDIKAGDNLHFSLGNLRSAARKIPLNAPGQSPSVPRSCPPDRKKAGFFPSPVVLKITSTTLLPKLSFAYVDAAVHRKLETHGGSSAT